ncbi:MAG: hypothetical protein WCV55_02455 [Candidatus Paceibacterota bacterium]
MSKKKELTLEEHKKKLALVFAGLITFFIFIVWILFFIGDAKKQLNKTSEGRVEIFSVFQDTMGKFADRFVNQFKTLPEKFVGTQTNLPAGDLNRQSSSTAVIHPEQLTASTTKVLIENINQ